MKKLFICTLLTFYIGLSALSAGNLKTGKLVHLDKLRVEYTETPLGIDVEKPRFSWQMQSAENGACQKAYQIMVRDEQGKKVWDTGKVKSELSLNIKYAGEALKPTTRYYWQLTVWNEKNKKLTSESWFETGLMNPFISAWGGAKWIGSSDDDKVLYSHYLPVFRIDYVLQLDEESKSTRAGFVFGANDERIKGESYYMLEIDLSPLALNDEASLNIYRVGFHPNDKKEQPLQSFAVPSIKSENKYEKHHITLRNDQGHASVHINNKEVARLGLNPLGQGGDFIAFPVVGDIGFSVPESQKAVFSGIEIRNLRAPGNILVKEPDRTVAGGTTGAFITYNPSRNSMPMLRTAFNIQGEIAKARLYVTARGIYDFYVNGQCIGNDYFNPGSTQYNKTLMYQTFDVTNLLQPGKNVVGAVLGEGWWSGGSTYSGSNWNFFGDRQSLLTKMIITYTDGKEDVIVSDPDSWQYFNNGPVVYGSFFQGEVYDTSKELPVEGWSTASYHATNWKETKEIPLAGTIAFKEDAYKNLQIIGQYGQTVKQIKELTAQSMEEVRPGIYIYDMGQNMVGVPNIVLNGMNPGQKINLRFAEVKYPDLPEYQDNVGMIMLENIRAAMAQDIYIAKGGHETVQPRFTYHGYRFIEITGIDAPLPLEAVKGVVLSSVHELASSYETSNSKVNKLWENITWSTYGNFLSIPTDCPQRNERMGWSGDISVFGRTATYLADVAQFLRRHLLAMRDTQRENGRFPDVAPMDVGFGGLLWGSAGITVAWETYQQYNDIDLLTEHYDAMKAYIHYILNETIEKETNLIVQNREWGDLGDWLGLEDERNDKSLFWEAYFIYDLEIMQKVATILGKEEDAGWFAGLHKDRKELFNQTYLHKESAKTVFSAFDKNRLGNLVDTQTSYVLPLAFNIVSEENRSKVINNLLETVVRENKTDNGTNCPPYSLMTGFIGTSWISKVLSDNGHSDVAYKLLLQTSYPSWLYSVEQGATTIWERLNSYTHTDGFGGNNRMNSFNHYSFGAVAAWMYNYSLGIQRDENYPGFKQFILKPQPDPTGGITSASGYYDSMYGRIESSWELKNNRCYYRFVVPANTSALLYLPGKESDEYIKLLPGVHEICVEN